MSASETQPDLPNEPTSETGTTTPAGVHLGIPDVHGTPHTTTTSTTSTVAEKPQAGASPKVSTPGGSLGHHASEHHPEGHASHRKRPMLSKLFVSSPLLHKRRDTPAKAKLAADIKLKPTLPTAEEEDEYNDLSEDCKISYKNVEALNKSLKSMKVHRFKLAQRHSISIDPSAPAGPAASVYHQHPFLNAHRRTSEVPAASNLMRRTSCVMPPSLSAPHMPVKSFSANRQRMHSIIPETSHDTEGDGSLGKTSRSLGAMPVGGAGALGMSKSSQRSCYHPVTIKVMEKGSTSGGGTGSGSGGSYPQGSVSATVSAHPPSRPQSDINWADKGLHPKQVSSHRRSLKGQGIRSSHLMASDHTWNTDLQGEFSLYTQLLSMRYQRRRSVICRQKWKKACTTISVIRQFCNIIAASSIEKKAHLKTFADIGDQATSETKKEEGFTLLDASFKSKKLEPGELYLSTKVKVLMIHPPETRTTDEVTLILCDLQCFPSFCAYPLAVQTKIARCGMLMPLGPRRVIVRQGHEAQNWYFVISGQAIETETINHEDGSQIQNTIKFISQGQTFGENALLKDLPQPYTVTSRKAMQLIRLAKEDFDEVSHRIEQLSEEVPEYVKFMKQQPFMTYFPLELLVKHPSMCCQYYYRPNTVLVKDSAFSDWIYVIRSGSCVVLMYVDSTKASWRDLELALSHPQVNVDGLPEPMIDTGPGKLPLRQTAYTLFQRMSAQDILASDLIQVPALHMTRGGSQNVCHGLHLLTGHAVSRMKCPWPLDFFDAMNRTAFTINLPHSQFPIDPGTGSIPNFEGKLMRQSINYAHPQHSQDAVDARGKKRSFGRSPSQRLSVGASKPKWAESHHSEAEFPFIDQNTNALSKDSSGSNNSGSSPQRKKTQTEEAAAAHRRVYMMAMKEQKERKGAHYSFTDSTCSASFSGRKASKGESHVEIKVPCVEKEGKGEGEGEEKANKGAVRKASSVKKTPSCTERRKQYVIPKHCKPQAPASNWKKNQTPYECTSPPVYIHIDVLTEGDIFGLDQLQEPGWERREQSGRVALISRGAEVVTLNKRFFMTFADDKTHVVIRDNMHIYPTRKAVQTRYRLQLAWDMYSQKIRDEYYEKLEKEGKKELGTYFVDTPVEIGDPYAILKEQ